MGRFAVCNTSSLYCVSFSTNAYNVSCGVLCRGMTCTASKPYSPQQCSLLTRVIAHCVGRNRATVLATKLRTPLRTHEEIPSTIHHSCRPLQTGRDCWQRHACQYARDKGLGVGFEVLVLHYVIGFSTCTRHKASSRHERVENKSHCHGIKPEFSEIG